MLQVHIETWLCTLHSAFIPHEPGHGSIHFSLIQALSLEQSEFIVHSGRQFGGVPMYFCKQEQDGRPLNSTHNENGPQGDGRHGFLETGSISGSI